MKEENRMMQDEMMNEEEIIGKEIEKSWKILREKILKKMRRKKK